MFSFLYLNFHCYSLYRSILFYVSENNVILIAFENDYIALVVTVNFTCLSINPSMIHVYI